MSVSGLYCTPSDHHIPMAPDSSAGYGEDVHYIISDPDPEWGSFFFDKSCLRICVVLCCLSSCTMYMYMYTCMYILTYMYTCTS